MDDNNKEKPDPQSDSSHATHAFAAPGVERVRIRQGLFAAGGILGAAIILLFTYIGFLIPATPNVDQLQRARTEQPSVLLSADGRRLASFRQVQQEWIPLERVSPHIVNALIATEDRRFYQHNGIDIGRTLAAAWRTAGGETQGGSTITQQLARNMFPDEIGRARTVNRKLKEVLTALKIERAYSKAQILETYLNTMPFLYNVTGIEMAARTYFGKSAAQLDALESATLVGMLKGTHYYNPVANPERALKRRNVVLAQMAKERQLSDVDYRTLRNRPLGVRFNRQIEQQDDSAPHFAAHVRKWLTEWADQNDIDLYSDGLIVHTTLDTTLQQAATRAVERQGQALQFIADVEWSRRGGALKSSQPSAYARMRHRVEPFGHFWNANPDLVEAFVRETAEFKQATASGASHADTLAQLTQNSEFIAHLRAAKTRLEAGLVAINPASGEIKAWVGSRDFERDQFDHVAQAARQPGSTFKPIVYGAALEQGLSPGRIYRDTAVDIRLADGSVWQPTDMSGPTGMPMTMRDGLIYSKNSITVQVMQDIGVPGIVDLAQALGIKRSKLDAVPSLALGTSPVTLLEMVSAYATIAAAGEYRKPVFVKRITDRYGNVIAEFDNPSERAMSADAAFELIDMMRGVVSRGTGQAVRTRFGIAADIAGKTGTTQNNADGWFILMHPNLVAGAWVGFNDARVTMRSNYWGQGGHNAIMLVGDFFRDTMRAKLIDGEAKFARPKRMPLLAETGAPPEDRDNRLAADPDDTLPVPGTGVIIHGDGRRTVIGGAPDTEMPTRRRHDAMEKTGGETPSNTRSVHDHAPGLGPNDISLPPR